MSDFIGKFVEGQDPFKQILKSLPGFKGYIDRENRRDADRLLREKVAHDFEALWRRISELQKEILNQGGLMYMDDLENAALKLRVFIDRIKASTFGQAGMIDEFKVIFNADQINDAVLKRLYEFDAALLGMVNEVSGAIDNVEAAIGTEGLAAAIRSLTTTAGQCTELYNRRSDVILQQPESTASPTPAAPTLSEPASASTPAEPAAPEPASPAPGEPTPTAPA